MPRYVVPQMTQTATQAIQARRIDAPADGRDGHDRRRLEQHALEPLLIRRERPVGVVVGDVLAAPGAAWRRGRRPPQDERLDGHRLDRRSELLRAVMRQDQMLDLERAAPAGSPGISRAASRTMPTPIDDVPDQIALDRVVGRDVVGQFLRACRCRAAARRRSAGRAARRRHRPANTDDLHDLQDVLEQAAAIGVMHLPRGRPDPQSSPCLATIAREQLRGACGSLDARDAARRAPPTSRRPAAATGMQSSSRKPFRASSGIDATDLVEDELEPLVEEIALAPARRRTRRRRTGRRLSTSWKTLASISPRRPGAAAREMARRARSAFLAGAQEKAGTRGGGVDLGDGRKARHRSGKCTARW